MANKIYTEEDIKNFNPPPYKCEPCGHKLY